MSALSLIPEERRKLLPNTSKSTESLYSSSSSKYSASAGLHKRKAASIRHAGFIPATNEVRQRVLSARRLRVKTLQNQLSDAQQRIVELGTENRILRTMHKRQDSALSKYENTNAELPQLLHSHVEEVRLWQTKYRSMQSQNKDLAYKLKQKDAMLLAFSDQNKHLSQLNRDKHLQEREHLTERVQHLENRLSEKDNDIKMLARRLQLEAKNFRVQLQNEHHKYKEVMGKLDRARTELGKLSQSQFDLDDKKAKYGFVPRSLSSSKLPKSSTDLNQKGGQSCCFHQTDSLQVNHSETRLSTIVRSDLFESESNNNIISTVRKSSTERMSRIDLNKNCDKPSELVDEIQKGISDLITNEENDSLAKNRRELEKLLSFDIEEQNEDDVKNDQPSSEEDFDENDIFAKDMPGFTPRNRKICTSENTFNTKEDFVSIRKQMSEEYEERESFLDAFCRQTTDENSISPNKVQLQDPNKRQIIDPKKKVQLLEALKAIDTDNDDTVN